MGLGEEEELKMSHRLNVKALWMWSLPLTFFAYQFILRLMPSLIVEDIMAKFSINASDFGWMSSLYYWGYAGMQIPIALMLERYSVRCVISLSALLAATGTLLFVYSDTWSLVLLGRFAIGVGSAVGFLGTSKVIMQWFPAHKYGWYVGITFSIGLLGAIYGGRPVASLVEQLSWHTAFTVVAFLGIALAFLIFIFLRAPYSQVESENKEAIIPSLCTILRRPALWILAVSNLLMVAPLEGFADVWGVTYFIKAFTWDKATAAGLCSVVYIGMLFGGPFLSFMAKYLKSESLAIVVAGLAMGGIFWTLFTVPFTFNDQTLLGAMFVVGLFCCYQVLIFSVGSQMVPDALKGITVAFLNCVNMIGGAFYHTLIGKALHLRASEGTAYTLPDYQFALSAIPIGCFLGGLGILAFMYLKDRYFLKQTV